MNELFNRGRCPRCQGSTLELQDPHHPPLPLPLHMSIGSITFAKAIVSCPLMFDLVKTFQLYLVVGGIKKPHLQNGSKIRIERFEFTPGSSNEYIAFTLRSSFVIKLILNIYSEMKFCENMKFDMLKIIIIIIAYILNNFTTHTNSYF
jgi:hypothetical protein